MEKSQMKRNSLLFAIVYVFLGINHRKKNQGLALPNEYNMFYKALRTFFGI